LVRAERVRGEIIAIRPIGSDHMARVKRLNYLPATLLGQSLNIGIPSKNAGISSGRVQNPAFQVRKRIPTFCREKPCRSKRLRNFGKLPLIYEGIPFYIPPKVATLQSVFTKLV